MTDTEEPLPIKFGPASNGEYLPYPPTALERETVRRTLELADVNARRLGMDRRTFLRSMCGAATMLFVLAGCANDRKRAASSRSSTTGGTYRVPSTATTEPEAAREVIGGDEFVFDVQTHLLDYTAGASPSGFGRGFPYADCGESNPFECFGLDHWFEEIFVKSDTAMAVISAVPILTDPNPLSIAVMERAKDAARRVCGDGRVFMQGQVNPNVGDLETVVAGMRSLRAEHQIVAWKAYTHVPAGRGWFLDDHDASAVQCGNAFLDAVRRIGPKVVCVHKGLGRSRYASPEDIGAAAKANPDIVFVVYHSGYDGPNEGPYTEANANVGVNRLITSLRRAGIGPNANVYAELGTTWWNAMRDPTQAAHVVGKLLRYVGEDRVVWGTDSIWYGSPQDQIRAFRAFQISDEFQERYGYPALTEEVKRKVLGETSAKLYGVDPVTTKCNATAEDVEALRASLPASTIYGPRTAEEVRALVHAHGGLI